MSSAATDVVRLLTVRGGTLAVAESLTGGPVAAEIILVPEASEVIRASGTALAMELTLLLPGAGAGLQAVHGAVDPQVAVRTAVGVREAPGADRGIAKTGANGAIPPDGRPSGTILVAGEGPSGTVSGSACGGKVEALRLNGDPADIRMESVRSVLAPLLTEIASEQTGNERAQDTERNGGF